VVRKVKILVACCLLVLAGLWASCRSGLFRKGTHGSRSAAQSSSVPVAPASVMPSNVSAAPPHVLAENPFPPSTSTLDDEDPSTFIAIRYDKTHVFFRLGENGDFTLDRPEDEKMLHNLPGPVAEHGGAPTSGPDAMIWQSLQDHFNQAHVGERWQLEVSAGSRIPVIVQKPIELVWGCSPDSYTAGFIAEVAASVQPTFAALPQNYFLVHKSPSGIAAPDPSFKQPKVGLLTDWQPSPGVSSQIEQAIVVGLKAEVAHQLARGSYGDLPRQLEQQAASGKAKLTYETQALQVSPDGFPRLFVRARWMVGNQIALLMTLWLRVGSEVTVEPVEENSTPVQWMSAKSLDTEYLGLNQLGSVLNVFDRPDGYGDVLIYFPGYEGYNIKLFRYTTAGPVATKISHGDGC
jgi:hypothetical protein